MFETQLFEGELVRFAAPDADKDAETESRWTLDLDYLHAINVRPAYPLSAHLIRKQHEEDQKKAEKDRLFRWAVRTKGADTGDRLIGWVKLDYLDLTHGNAEIALGIGDAADRGKGFGSDALRLALRFAFDELNLHRLLATIGAYNDGAIRFFGRFGFIEEVRRREAFLLNGKRYDDVWLSLLRREWAAHG
jgi:RimJ/RimL family protein N-acetyltransferase